MNDMPVKRFFGAIAFAGLMTLGSAMAAGPYDGQWNANITFGVAKCGAGDFPVTVADSKLTGTYKGVWGSSQVSGTVAADGSYRVDNVKAGRRVEVVVLQGGRDAFEQGHAHFAQGRLHILRREASFAAQVLEDTLQFVGQIIEHSLL